MLYIELRNKILLATFFYLPFDISGMSIAYYAIIKNKRFYNLNKKSQNY